MNSVLAHAAATGWPARAAPLPERSHSGFIKTRPTTSKTHTTTPTTRTNSASSTRPHPPSSPHCTAHFHPTSLPNTLTLTTSMNSSPPFWSESHEPPKTPNPNRHAMPLRMSTSPLQPRPTQRHQPTPFHSPLPHLNHVRLPLQNPQRRCRRNTSKPTPHRQRGRPPRSPRTSPRSPQLPPQHAAFQIKQYRTRTRPWYNPRGHQARTTPMGRRPKR